MTDFHIKKTNSTKVTHEDESVPPQPEQCNTPLQIIDSVLEEHDIQIENIFPNFP